MEYCKGCGNKEWSYHKRSTTIQMQELQRDISRDFYCYFSMATRIEKSYSINYYAQMIMVFTANIS